jgi:hypothetical protein
VGEVTKSKVVRAASKAALEAAAAKECAQQTAAPDCERVLVVYGAQAASIYVESTPPAPRPAVSRRAS